MSGEHQVPGCPHHIGLDQGFMYKHLSGFPTKTWQLPKPRDCHMLKRFQMHECVRWHRSKHICQHPCQRGIECTCSFAELLLVHEVVGIEYFIINSGGDLSPTSPASLTSMPIWLWEWVEVDGSGIPLVATSQEVGVESCSFPRSLQV